jgi:hypothetical protein
VVEQLREVDSGEASITRPMREVSLHVVVGAVERGAGIHASERREQGAVLAPGSIARGDRMGFDDYRSSNWWPEAGERSSASQWFSRSSPRTKLLVVLGALAVIAIVIFALAWHAHVSDPIYRFHKIETGMTFAEVLEVMGESSEAYRSEPISDGEYMLTAHGGMVQMYVTFKNGRVVSKDIRNWEI